MSAMEEIIRGKGNASRHSTYLIATLGDALESVRVELPLMGRKRKQW
jgi:hypothetical protein